jgi:hypothetical protein
MNKPEKQNLLYNNYHSVEKYLLDNKIWTNNLADYFWKSLCNEGKIRNGTPFNISDWELKHENGKFSYLVDKKKRIAIESLLAHFGESDKNCLDSNVLTATFIVTW